MKPCSLWHCVHFCLHAYSGVASLFTLPFGLLISGFALLVAYLGQNNPQITPLMPVLLSPWLSIHVSLIMVSYALFAFMMLNGLLAFCIGGWRKKDNRFGDSGTA